MVLIRCDFCALGFLGKSTICMGGFKPFGVKKNLKEFFKAGGGV
jgi:hypothetical protein